MPIYPAPRLPKGLRRLVMLDRYAMKHQNPKQAIADALAAGDQPLVLADLGEEGKSQLVIGRAVAFDGEGSVEVILEDQNPDDGPCMVSLDRISVPLEKTPEEIWARMAHAVTEFEERVHKTTLGYDEYYDLFEDFRFVPGGRIYAALGTDYERTFFNCYVFPIEPDFGKREEVGCDSRQAILDTLKRMVETMSRGGGVGINLGVLRPRDAVVRGVAGRSSGAVSWGEIFSFATGLISQGGSRRGALMEILPVWHPDILEFIRAKRDMTRLTNCNISVGITEEFERALEADGDFDLIFPDYAHPGLEPETYNKYWDGDIKTWQESGLPIKVYKTVRARDLFREIVESAWASGEPGVVRLDYANSMSNSYYYATLIGTNPCGEQPLPPYGVCNLGHINLSRFLVKKDKKSPWQVDWERLGKAVHKAVQFLDDLIDMEKYSLRQVEQGQRFERRVGLGTMGLAEMLLRLGIRYGSDESIDFIEKLYAYIRDEAYKASVQLAATRGKFPAFRPEYLQSAFIGTLPEEIQALIREHGIRNVTLLTQAPTGTVGTMAGTSTGIEPYYQWRYTRSGRFGDRIEVVEPIIEEEGEEILKTDAAVTAMDLTPEEHIRVQAAIQKYVDSSISKTANLPADYTVEQTEQIYRLALKLGCKGVTVYRDQSRDQQVLALLETSTPSSVPVLELRLDEGAGKNKPPVHRPQTTHGYTERIETPLGKIYITTGFNDQGMVEAFLRGPADKSLPGEGEEQAVPRTQYEMALRELSALTEALGIMISEALKWGASPARIARQLAMPHGNYFFHRDEGAPKGVGLRGITAAVAHALDHALATWELNRYGDEFEVTVHPDDGKSAQNTVQVTTEREETQPADTLSLKVLCPECGAAMVKTDCWNCPNCGYSKCG